MSEDDLKGPERTPGEGYDAFSGASRAAGYVEGIHTATPVVEPVPEIAWVDAPVFAVPEVAIAVAPAVPDEPADLFEEPIVDLGLVSSTPKPVTAKEGLRGALGKLGIRLAPGARERGNLDTAEQLRRHEEIIRQATWTRAVSVLVANRKGGVGKTPVSLLLGGTLAAVRGGSVCIMEVSDDPGALTFRAEGSPHLGIGELVRDVATITTAGQLAGYTAPQTSFASVIGSTGRRTRLTRESVIGVAGVVDDFYAVRVMDSGNQPSSSAFQGAIETADCLVVPVLNAGDAVLEALALLEELRAAGGKAAALADRAIIVRLTDGRPEHQQVVERVNRIIVSANVGQVFTVPYDSHIAERGQLTVGSLAPATYRAFAAAAAGVVRSLHTGIH